MILFGMGEFCTYNYCVYFIHNSTIRSKLHINFHVKKNGTHFENIFNLGCHVTCRPSTVSCVRNTSFNVTCTRQTVNISDILLMPWNVRFFIFFYNININYQWLYHALRYWDSCRQNLEENSVALLWMHSRIWSR